MRRRAGAFGHGLYLPVERCFLVGRIESGGRGGFVGRTRRCLDVYEWVLRPCEPLFVELAPSPAPGSFKVTLRDYLWTRNHGRAGSK